MDDTDEERCPWVVGREYMVRYNDISDKWIKMRLMCRTDQESWELMTETDYGVKHTLSYYFRIKDSVGGPLFKWPEHANLVKNMWMM